MKIKKFSKVREREVVQESELDKYKSSITGITYICTPNMNGYEVDDIEFSKGDLEYLMGEIVHHKNKISNKQKIIKPKKGRSGNFPHQKNYTGSTFLEFANLNYNEGKIINFANKYGLLDFWKDQEEPEYQDDLFEHLKPHPFGYSGYKKKHKQYPKGELLNHWYFEIFYMKRVLKMWNRCWTDDVDDPSKWEYGNVGEYLQWEFSEDEDADGNTIDSKEGYCISKFWKIPYEDRSPDDNLNLDKYFIDTTDSEEGSIDSAEPPDYGSDDFRRDYLDHITTIINKSIAGRLELATVAPFYILPMINYEKNPESLWSREEALNQLTEEGKQILSAEEPKKKLKDPKTWATPAPNIRLVWKPNSLIGALWRDCLSFLELQRRVEFCKDCNNFFHKKRTQQMFCSDTCRGRHFQKKKKPRNQKGQKNK